jgi:tetratricopeptide (TPR) repeat protein
VLELNPNYLIARSFLAEAYEQKGDFVSAMATIEKIQQAETDSLTLSTVGYVYAKSGDRHKALEILNEFVKRSNQEYVPALNFAQIYAGLGDNGRSPLSLALNRSHARAIDSRNSLEQIFFFVRASSRTGARART